MAKNSINVNRGVHDPFYRYKMPRILAKVEGKGNDPTKYFGCELGAQTNFDLKNERYIVNGEHDANKLQDILDGFIRKFVLCPSCDNPETVLTVKRQVINGKCKACGHTYMVDPKQKLSTFILKNPPPSENNDAEKDGKNDNGVPTEEANETAAVVENALICDAVSNGGDDEDWAPEPAEEEEKLSSQIGKLVIDKDLDKSVEERLDLLHQFFLKAVKNNTIQDSKKMLNEAERLELKSKAPLLLADVLFDVNVISQIKQHRNLLLRFCLKDEKAQRILLGGIEQLVQKNKGVLMSKTAHIIKALYDNDICEEDVVLAWGSKPSKKFADKEVEAEEGSDESEDDLEVAFDDRSRNIGMTVEVDKKAMVGAQNGVSATNGKTENAGGAEDIDIDDI
uniref:Eukaryotic translation initiation factor 5 n=1 Tax=Globodera pallida TaxID=36090 RepID=A0A183BJV6_GLOPA